MEQKIINLQNEINSLQKSKIYYEDIIIKCQYNIDYIDKTLNTIKNTFPKLEEVIDIVERLKTITSTNEFDYIEDMVEYLNNNVDKKDWIKFNSLYLSCTKLLDENNLRNTYIAYADLKNTQVDYKISAHNCNIQVYALDNLINKKKAKLSKLKEKYNSLNINKKEENIFNM